MKSLISDPIDIDFALHILNNMSEYIKIVEVQEKGCMCQGCPFDFLSMESEIAQNYGCLPTPFEIINMRVNHNKTWACHSEPTTPCIGAINYLKDKGKPYKVVDKDLLTENSNWNEYIS
ncbi:MAG: hypothetical protein WC679_00310 [Bacteroidales bacterium]|jgi:hypothetical protein